MVPGDGRRGDGADDRGAHPGLDRHLRHHLLHLRVLRPLRLRPQEVEVLQEPHEPGRPVRHHTVLPGHFPQPGGEHNLLKKIFM